MAFILRHDFEWCLSWQNKHIPGGVAEWLCSGLQSRGRRFDSDPRLQINE
jgi:hypothetical protein